MLDELASELIALKAEDLRVRSDLVKRGELGHGYQPEMEQVHRRNAARLRGIVNEHGWPGRTLVGDEAADAAWLILQHAIGEPAMQRSYLPLLEAAARNGEIPPHHPAYLHDRICFFEGRPQRFGTQGDLDDEGYTVMYRVEDPDRLDERRASVGLGPQDRSRHGKPAPSNAVEEQRRRMAEWAKSVGWLA